MATCESTHLHRLQACATKHIVIPQRELGLGTRELKHRRDACATNY